MGRQNQPDRFYVEPTFENPRFELLLSIFKVLLACSPIFVLAYVLMTSKEEDEEEKKKRDCKSGK